MDNIEWVLLKGVGPHGNEWELEVGLGPLTCLLCEEPATTDNVSTFAFREGNGSPVCGACVTKYRAS